MPTFKEIMNTKRGVLHQDILSKYFYQPISNLFLYLCLKFNISANEVSKFMAVISIIAGVLFLSSNRLDMIVGSTLFIFAMMLDHLDGCIARATNTFSKKGGFFDNIHHKCEEIFVFIGLGLFLNKEYLGILIVLIFLIINDMKAITFWFCKRDVYYDSKYRKLPIVLLFGDFFKIWHILILFSLIYSFEIYILYTCFIWSILRFIPTMYIYYKECDIYDKER